MSGMSPERLAEVARLVDLDIGLDRKGAADLLAEVKRLRTIEAGVEALTRTGFDHTPDCVQERERGWLDWHPDCGRCWQDSLHDLLNLPAGEAS